MNTRFYSNPTQNFPRSRDVLSSFAKGEEEGSGQRTPNANDVEDGKGNFYLCVYRPGYF